MQPLQDPAQPDHVQADLRNRHKIGGRTVGERFGGCKKRGNPFGNGSSPAGDLYFVIEGDAGNEFFYDSQLATLFTGSYNAGDPHDGMLLKVSVDIGGVDVEDLFHAESAGLPVADQIDFVVFVDGKNGLIIGDREAVGQIHACNSFHSKCGIQSRQGIVGPKIRSLLI